MEENNQNNQSNVNAENIKKEAKETVNQVKDSFKNIDMKQETEKAKNYFSRFLKQPIKVIGEIAHDKSNAFFKTAIVILVIWIVASLLNSVESVLSSLFTYGISGYSISYIFKTIFSSFFSIIKSILTTIISIAVLSGIIYIMNNKNKKSFLTNAITIIAAFAPKAVAEVISLLTIIPGAYRITSPVNGLLGIIATVFAFFAIKELNDEKEDDSAIKKFIIVEAIYYVVKFVLSFFTIYI